VTKIMADNSVRDRNVLGVNVSLRKFQLTLGLAAAALAFAAGSATAQEKRLEVRVNMPRIDCPTCAPIIRRFSDETLPVGAIRFKAMLHTRTLSGDWDEGIDVTHEANWELNGGEAVMIEPGVSLSLKPDKSVRWIVTHPAVDSFKYARIRPLLLRPATPEDDFTPAAQEKRLEVLVNMPRVDCPTCAPFIRWFSDKTLPPGAVRFKAMLQTRTPPGRWDEGVDVTHEANWELNGGEAVMIEPGVSLSLKPDESVRWYVTHPATDSADFARVRPLLLRPATPEDDFTPTSWPPYFPKEPVGSPDARLNVMEALARIEHRSGVPTRGLMLAADGVSFGNNADYSRRAYSVLCDEVIKLLGPDQSAVTLFPKSVKSGISHNGFEMAIKERPFVVLTQTYFANIAAQNLIDTNGIPNATMRLIIRELIHVIIDEKKIKFDAKDVNGDGAINRTTEDALAIEEQVAHAFETNFLRWNEQIKDILKNAEGRALTEQEIARIAGILRAMKAETLRLRLLAPGDFDALLIELRWTDANNNGIFDFLEGWLTERQLNIEELLKPLPTPRGGEPEKVTPPDID